MRATNKGIKTMDKNVKAVQRKMAQRTAKWISNDEVTTERGDLSEVEWLQHLQDELMDASVYVQRLIQIKLEKLEQSLLQKSTPRGGRDKERPVKQKVSPPYITPDQISNPGKWVRVDLSVKQKQKRGGRDKERPVLQ